MNFPKVSIITPSFNQGHFIERTILSVLNQDYPNIEYIVIDGGSSDNSVDIIKKYEDKIAFWVSEKDKGHCNAINKGFRRATGEILNWLNSDDILLPNAVSIAVHYLQKFPDYKLVYGDRLVISENGQVLSVLELPPFNKFLTMFKIKIPQETSFFTKEIWEKTNELDEGLDYALDSDLFYRFLKYSDFYHIPFIMGAYRDQPSSKSVQGYGKNRKTENAKKESKIISNRYRTIFYKNRILRRIAMRLNDIRFLLYRNSSKRNKERAEILKFISSK